MSNGYITLRSFSSAQLIFDEAETKQILKFFFSHLSQRIDVAPCTESLRNFAQGLLVEAVDATYALSYVEIVFRTFYSPSSGVKSALKKLARRSASNWFKHATQKDLLNAKISGRVRDQLAFNFASVFPMMLEGVAANAQPRKFAGRVNYGQPSPADKIWG